MSAQARTRRGWIVPAAVASTAVVASLAVGTLGAYTATINGENNLAGSGTLTMSESLVGADGELTDTINTAMAGDGTNAIESTINRYGADGVGLDMVPGDSVSTTIEIQNTGEVAGLLGLEVRDPAVVEVTGDTFTPIVPQPEISLADTLEVTLQQGNDAPLYTGPLSGFVSENHFAEGNAPELGATDAVRFTFTIAFPSETEGETSALLMGQDVQQGLTWTLTSTGAENEEVAE